MTEKVCKIDGCSEQRYLKNASCREHTYENARAWRAANREAVKKYNLKKFIKAEGKTYLDKNDGYIKYQGVAHPACNPSGITRFHRLVLWDKLSGENTPCAECGEMVFWDVAPTDPNYLVADHIDGDKTHNVPENLDPVHALCNTRRAVAMRNKKAEEEQS